MRRAATHLLLSTAALAALFLAGPQLSAAAAAETEPTGEEAQRGSPDHLDEDPTSLLQTVEETLPVLPHDDTDADHAEEEPPEPAQPAQESSRDRRNSPRFPEQEDTSFFVSPPQQGRPQQRRPQQEELEGLQHSEGEHLEGDDGAEALETALQLPDTRPEQRPAGPSGRQDLLLLPQEERRPPQQGGEHITLPPEQPQDETQYAHEEHANDDDHFQELQQELQHQLQHQQEQHIQASPTLPSVQQHELGHEESETTALPTTVAPPQQQRQPGQRQPQQPEQPQLQPQPQPQPQQPQLQELELPPGLELPQQLPAPQPQQQLQHDQQLHQYEQHHPQHQQQGGPAAVPASADTAASDPRLGRCTKEELAELARHFADGSACPAFGCIDTESSNYLALIEKHYGDKYSAAEAAAFAGVLAACHCRCPVMRCEVEYVQQHGSSKCKDATREFCLQSNTKFSEKCSMVAKQLPKVYDIDADPHAFKSPCQVCEPEMPADATASAQEASDASKDPSVSAGPVAAPFAVVVCAAAAAALLF